MSDDELPEVLAHAADAWLPGTPILINADLIGGPFEGRRPVGNMCDGYPADVLTITEDNEQAVYLLEAHGSEDGPAWVYRFSPEQTAERKERLGPK